MRVVIVDDEPVARQSVRLVLAGRSDVAVVGEAGTVADAVRVITETVADIVFLDVRMPDGDGFEVLAQHDAASPPSVVMVTAFDGHAVQAFEHEAIAYVMKPFTDAQLLRALDRAMQVRVAASSAQRAQALEAALRSLASGGTLAHPGPLRRMLVTRGQSSAFVAVEDIDWMEAAGNYVCLHVGAEEFLVRGSLSSVLARLDPAEFVRVHRSRAIQVRRIREVLPSHTGDFFAVLHDGQRLRVSRLYREELLRSR